MHVGIDKHSVEKIEAKQSRALTPNRKEFWALVGALIADSFMLDRMHYCPAFSSFLVLVHARHFSVWLNGIVS